MQIFLIFYLNLQFLSKIHYFQKSTRKIAELHIWSLVDSLIVIKIMLKLLCITIVSLVKLFGLFWFLFLNNQSWDPYIFCLLNFKTHSELLSNAFCYQYERKSIGNNELKLFHLYISNPITVTYYDGNFNTTREDET